MAVRTFAYGFYGYSTYGQLVSKFCKAIISDCHWVIAFGNCKAMYFIARMLG